MSGPRSPCWSPAPLSDGLLLSTVNEASQAAHGVRRERKRFVQLLADHLPGAPFRLPHAMLEQVLARHRDDIAWLQAETGLDLGQPDPPPDSPAEPPASDRVLVPLLLALADKVSALSAELEKSPAQSAR